MLRSLVLVAGLAQSIVPRLGLDVAPADQRVWQLQQAERAREDAVKLATGATPNAAAVRALLQLHRVDEALDRLLRVVTEKPDEAPAALRGLDPWRNFSDGTRDYSSKLTAIFAAAHAQAGRLPKEEAAVLEFALVDAEGVLHRGSETWRQRARAAADHYVGTHAATLAEIQSLTYDNMQARLDALDVLAHAHPGTDIAAAALYQKGWDLAMNAFVTGKDRQPDPTDRFMRVVAIVDQLEGETYPKGDWTDKAPQLLINFNSYKPEYAPGHIDDMIEAYRTFLRRHFTLDLVNPFDNNYGYVVNSKLGDLFKLKGDADGIDRTLRELETESPDREGAGFLRALRAPAGAARTGRLEVIASNPQNAYAPKAIATLALDDLQAGRNASARERFQRFVERYPRSEYAWIASLHAAEALTAAGDWAAAEREFAATAATYSDTTMAVILGRALAAHCAEAVGEATRAADHYTVALTRWDRDTYQVSLYTTRESPIFRRAEVAQRMSVLRASLAKPGGDLLERGRWQLGNGQRAAAMTTLEDALARFPRSPLRAEASLLLHRAQLETALDLANIERPDGNPAAASVQIDELSRQPLDSAIVAACIARASQLWSQGKTEDARDAMTSALGDWIKAQPRLPPNGDLERDLAAIRNAVFRPLGDGIFAARSRWNAFTWPPALPRFLLMDPEITVKLASGDETAVVVTSTLPGLPNVIFADKTMLDLLSRTIASLGGTKRRQPTAVMETPNQPIGESMNILALWNEYFPTRPGHWGGFEFTSYPRLTRIEFLDAARTRAAVNVTIGYSGCTVMLQKRDGVWTTTRLTNEWIT